MIIVSDTSTITALLQIGQADVLSRLYQNVIIPREVELELRRFHSSIPSFFTVISVTDQRRFHDFCGTVDAGEAAALTLMIEGKGDLLLIDEQRGRKLAEREGIPVIGLLGVLLEAKSKGIIPTLAETIDQLEHSENFRISRALRIRALAAAGEHVGSS